MPRLCERLQSAAEHVATQLRAQLAAERASSEKAARCAAALPRQPSTRDLCPSAFSTRRAAKHAPRCAAALRAPGFWRARTTRIPWSLLCAPAARGPVACFTAVCLRLHGACRELAQARAEADRARKTLQFKVRSAARRSAPPLERWPRSLSLTSQMSPPRPALRRASHSRGRRRRVPALPYPASPASCVTLTRPPPGA